MTAAPMVRGSVVFTSKSRAVTSVLTADRAGSDFCVVKRAGNRLDASRMIPSATGTPAAMPMNTSEVARGPLPWIHGRIEARIVEIG